MNALEIPSTSFPPAYSLCLAFGTLPVLERRTIRPVGIVIRLTTAFARRRQESRLVGSAVSSKVSLEPVFTDYMLRHASRDMADRQVR